MTPVANNVTSFTWTFPLAFSAEPAAVVTANTTATTVQNTSMDGSPGLTSCKPGIYRTNNKYKLKTTIDYIISHYQCDDILKLCQGKNELKYCIIKICCRHGLAIHNSQDGKERNRQQRGYGKRESLGYPPCCHKNCDSQCGGHLWVFRVNISKKEQEQCQHRNNYKTYNLFESQLVCQSSSNIQEFQK